MKIEGSKFLFFLFIPSSRSASNAIKSDMIRMVIVKRRASKNKNKIVLGGIIVIVMFVIGFSVWTLWISLDYSEKTKHETSKWAVIADSKGEIIALETTNPDVWDTLVSLYDNQTEMWIGGIIEEYDNYWGFRFKPDTIIIAQITIEGAQSNIQGINENLTYWMNVWTKETYVLAEVLEINQ